MTEQEFKTYSELQVKFAEDVMRVAEILGRIDRDVAMCQDFYLEDGTVYTHGQDLWSNDDYEEYRGEFPAEMLMWSNEKLKEHVDNILKKREEAKLIEEEFKNKQKELEERKELERLKAKYELGTYKMI